MTNCRAELKTPRIKNKNPNKMSKHLSLIITITILNLVLFGCNKKSTTEEINDQHFL